MGLTRKQIVMLAVLVFGTFVTVLNQTVVAPALPSAGSCRPPARSSSCPL